MESLEPVAVGYRTLPLAELLPNELRTLVLAVPAAIALAEGSVEHSRPPKERVQRSLPGPNPAPVKKTKTPSNAMSGSSGNARTTPGLRWGVFLGSDNGLRAQVRPGDGRNGFGVRAGVGFGLLSLSSPYVQAGGAIEWEHRRSPDARTALLLSAGGGISAVYVGGGIGVVRDIGDNHGRFEAELFAGAYGVAPRVAYGWMW